MKKTMRYTQTLSMALLLLGLVGCSGDDKDIDKDKDGGGRDSRAKITGSYALGDEERLQCYANLPLATEARSRLESTTQAFGVAGADDLSAEDLGVQPLLLDQCRFRY